MENIRKSGILAHPTSFPSPFGIGDMGKGAYDFLDFLSKSGQKIWQTLPLGSTGFKDSPYQSFSAFAGNFYLISPQILFEKGLPSKSDIYNIPSLPDAYVDFGNVIKYKNSLFKKAFIAFSKSMCSDREFIKFKSENAFWLKGYSLFMAIKDYYINARKNEYESGGLKKFINDTKDFLSPETQLDYYYGGVWASWESGLIKRIPETINFYSKKLQNEIEFYNFLQFEFFSEWEKLKLTANEMDIKIIGDIPIFVAWDSADVWENQELFYLNPNGFPTEVAGVPPDYFSAKGQLWGNPLYKWDNHIKTGLKWWTGRIKNCLKTCDIMRIDHFRGFEAYYAIPFGSKDAIKGEWRKGPGKEFFDIIKKSVGSLPFIAEDLGIITKEVENLRDSIGLPGMRVLQFAFDDSENNAYLPHNHIKNCIVYTGTHDNDTSKGWYNSAPEFSRDALRRYMNTSGSDPSWDMIRLAFSSCANTAIFPLQDVLRLGPEGRMNTPGTSSGNWKWRYKENDLTGDLSDGLLYLNRVFKRNLSKQQQIVTTDIHTNIQINFK